MEMGNFAYLHILPVLSQSHAQIVAPSLPKKMIITVASKVLRIAPMSL
jgi:hypothetical protein